MDKKKRRSGKRLLKYLRLITLLMILLFLLPYIIRAEEFVDPRTGRLILSSTDLEMQAGPLALQVERILLSGGKQFGLLGFKWQLNWESKLLRSGPTIAIFESGTVIIFESKSEREFFSPSGDRLLLTQDGRALLKRGDGTTATYDTGGLLIEKEDNNGNKISLLYGRQGRLERIEGPNGVNLKFTTDSQGKINLIESSTGDMVRYAYEKENLTSVQVNGRTPTRYRYNNNGALVRIENPLTGSVDLTFDSAGRVTNRRWGDMSQERLEFDDTRRTVRHINPSGGVTTFYRSEDGRKEEITDPLRNKTVIEYNENLLPVKVTGPTGATSKMRYDAQGRLIEVVGVSGSSSRFEYAGETSLYRSIIEGDGTRYDFAYDDKRNLLSVKRDGEVIHEFTYFSNGLLKSSKREGIPERKYNYYPNGLLRAETDALGWTTTYEYDTRGNRVREINPLRGPTIWKYDEQDRLVSSTDPAGATTRYEYDAAGHLVKIVDPTGGITQFEHDSRGRTVSMKDPVGRITRYQYDKEGRLISEADGKGSAYRYEFDSAGNMIQEINPLGGVTARVYNPLGQVIKETSPLGKTWSYHYSQAGLLTQSTGPSGEAIKYQYDALGRMKEVIDPKGRGTRYDYDRKGQVVKITVPDGGVSTYSYGNFGNLSKEAHNRDVASEYLYDGEGRVIREQRADGLEISYEYDGLGNLIRWRDNLGGESNLKYNPQGLVTEIRNAAGAVQKYQYDLSGMMIASVDPLNNMTQLSYNPAGDLTEAKKPSGDTVKYFYDISGNMSEIHHPAGGVTKLTYDPMDNLVIRENPIDGKTRYAYDKAGQLISETDAKGQTTTFTYDDSGLLSQKRFADGKIVKYRYDTDGNLLEVDDGTFPVRYTYDSRGLLTRIEYPAIKRTLRYEYDETGLLSKFFESEGRLITYEYNKSKLLSSMSLPGKGRFDFDYDAKGRLISLVYPNGTKGMWEYDATGRLTRITYTASSGKVISGWRHSYDAANNLLSVADIHGRTTQYQYDNTYQIKEERSPTGTIRYTYLPSGNRGVVDRDGRSVQYAYNRADQLLKTNEETFQYDANGNLVERKGPKGITQYQYDMENRLIRVTKPDGKEVSFGYAPTGERIWRKDSTGLTYFVTDGTNVLVELDDQLKLKSSYVHGPGIDNPLMLLREGQSHFYHTNLIGSVAALTDANGIISASYETDAFGNVFDQKGLAYNPYIFTAREYEPEIGLYYYRARYYDPMLGRFLGEDPIRDPFKPNQYAYVSNAPTRYRDPFGLIEVEPIDDEILRQHNLTRDQFMKRLVIPETKRLNLMDKFHPPMGPSTVENRVFAERMLENKLRMGVPENLLRKEIAERIRTYRRDIQAAKIQGMEPHEYYELKGLLRRQAEAREAQARAVHHTEIGPGGGAPPRPGVPTGQHGAVQSGSTPSGPKPPAPAAPGGAVVAKSQPSPNLPAVVDSKRNLPVVVDQQPGRAVKPYPRYLGPQGSNTGPDNNNWKRISTNPTGPPPKQLSEPPPILNERINDPKIGLPIFHVLVTTEQLIHCRENNIGMQDCLKNILIASGKWALIEKLVLAGGGTYGGIVLKAFGTGMLYLKLGTDITSILYNMAAWLNAEWRASKVMEDREKSKEANLQRLDQDMRNMKAKIDNRLKGPAQEHKAACEALKRMLEIANQCEREAEGIGYRIPTRETIGVWEKMVARCKKAEVEKGSDEKLEKLRNEAQKNGRDLNSKFKRAESLAQSCRDPEDSPEISNAIKSCEDDFIKIKYRADEAIRLGKEVKEFETEVKNTKSELNAALKDRDKLIALTKKFPTRIAWDAQVEKVEKTKELLMKEIKNLEDEIKTLLLKYPDTYKMEAIYESKVVELKNYLTTYLTTHGMEVCDVGYPISSYNASFEKLELIEVTAANRLWNGLKLNDELSECLKVGRMNQLADIEKVQKEAEKLMAGIQKLQQGADRCSKIRYVICIDTIANINEPVGSLTIRPSKKALEKQKIWHVVLGPPHESEEKAELAYLQIAGGARRLENAGLWTGTYYILAGGRKCLVDEKFVKQKPPAVALLPPKRVDDLEPKENEWFVYVNVVDASGKGIPSASVYSHDIGGYQSKNLGGGRFRLGPFWKRSSTDKRSIEIRAEVMFRSPQSFAYMPRYKNVPVLLADQSTVEVTIQFTEEGDFMRVERPDSIRESSVETEGSLRQPPASMRDPSVETGAAGEIPPFLLDSKTKGKLTGRATGGATTPPPPTVKPDEGSRQPPQPSPPTLKRSREDCIYKYCPMCKGNMVLGKPFKDSDCDRCIKANQANIDRCVDQ